MSNAIVLVVEDEPLLRLHVFDMIEDAGFEVIEAADADEAIRILEERPDIRIVMTDIDMPGSMNGEKLAAVVRDRWPPVEIIIVSGQRSAKDVSLPERGLFFSKPYEWSKIIEALKAFAP